MAFDRGRLLTTAFLGHLKDLIGRHHMLYPLLPPKGFTSNLLSSGRFCWPVGHANK